jgi:uncharacterized membrane protein (Fun14 family)
MIRNILILILLSGATIIFASEITNNGYLTVNYDQTGRIVYLDGDSIGVTPINNYAIKPGEYSVSLFSSDTIEGKYWKIAAGIVSSRLSGLWDLTKVGVATQRVEISPNQMSVINFSLKEINRAPTKAKLSAACCVGTGFSIAFLLGFLVSNWVR